MLVGNNIAKSYPNKLVLQNVDFEAKSGDMIVLTGENGSGKTTLLDMLASLKKPDSGTLELDNELFTTNDIRQQIAYLNIVNLLAEYYLHIYNSAGIISILPNGHFDISLLSIIWNVGLCSVIAGSYIYMKSKKMDTI